MTSHINIENGRCVWHDPTRKGKADAMRRRAGKVGAQRKWERVTPPPPPQTTDDAVRYASYVAHAVATGALDPRKGQIVVKALDTFTRAFDRRELEQRVRALQALVKKHKLVKEER
jgi:hypothetical protein